MVVGELDVDALRAENAALRMQIAGLVEHVGKLNERVAELLAIAQRKQREFQTVAKLRLNMLFAGRAHTAPASCSASSPPAARSASRPRRS